VNSATHVSAKVADASVLAAMAFRERRADEAMSLLHRATLYEPLLLPFELANIAWKKARREPSRTSAILRQLERVLSTSFIWVPIDHSALFELALRSGLTAYDASYLAVARQVGASLVTFDQGLEAVWTAGP